MQHCFNRFINEIKIEYLFMIKLINAFFLFQFCNNFERETGIELEIFDKIKGDGFKLFVVL